MLESTPLLGSVTKLFHNPSLSPSSIWFNISTLRALSRVCTFLAWLINVVLASPLFPGHHEFCVGSADVLNFIAGVLSLINAQILQPRLNVLCNQRLWHSFGGALGEKLKKTVTQYAIIGKNKLVVGEDLVDDAHLPSIVGNILNFFALTNLYAALLEGFYALC